MSEVSPLCHSLSSCHVLFIFFKKYSTFSFTQFFITPVTSICLSNYVFIIFLSKLKGKTHFRGIPHFSHRLKRCWDTNIIITEREKERKQAGKVGDLFQYVPYRFSLRVSPSASHFGVYSTEEPKTDIVFVSHTSNPGNLCEGIFRGNNLQFSSLLPFYLQSSCGLLKLVRMLCIYCNRFTMVLWLRGDP